MKRPFIMLVISVLLVACGGAQKASVMPPDAAAYKTVEITANSNSGRIITLEQELDTAKTEIESLRVQNRQLADSYDGLVELFFKEHRGLTMMLIEKMNILAGATAPEEKK